MKTGTRNLTRRAFLLRASALAAGACAPRWSVPSIWGANEMVAPSNRIAVGLIGRGAMGSGHLPRLAGDPGFQLVGVCDVDRERREKGREYADSIYAADRAKGAYHGCAAYNDYRELLARPEVDAVLIATPDHWHTPQALDAAIAGKDVYCEKPVSLTIREGRLLADTVRRYGRVFQTGTQYRSIPAIRRVCQFVREGGLGRVKSVFALWNNLSIWIGSERFKPYAGVMNLPTCGKSYVPLNFPLPAEPVPDGLDWDRWVGPAPWRPYNRLYHVNPSPGVVPWSFCDAFGATSLTWHLAHSADVIQYALGVETSGPVEIIHPRTREFPTLTCRYANGTLLHLVDNWGMVKELYHAVPATARLAGNFGGLFVGERGWLTSMTTGGPIEGGPEEIFSELKLRSRDAQPGDNDHHANWLACIKSRQKTSCDAEIGHCSATLGHLANIACWTGSSLRWDPVREAFASNAMASRLMSRADRERVHRL